MKVVLYSRSFPPLTGGMERFAATLASWLFSRGIDITVVTHSPQGPEGDDSIPYRVIRQPSLRQLVGTMKSADLVHVNGLSLRGWAASLLAQKQPVISHHSHQAICPTGIGWIPNNECSAGPRPGPCNWCPGRGLFGLLKVRAHRFAAFKSQRNICVSNYLCRRLGVSESTAIYNPIAPSFFGSSNVVESQDLVIFAGRLVREKGLDQLLKAMVHVPEARLEILGDGPMRASMVKLIEYLNIGRRVTFHGEANQSMIIEAYARATVVCVPSLWHEPFGYAAAEAMASGSAVVGTPRGALVELLAGGRGFLARSTRAEDIAESVREAFDSEERRREVSRRALLFAQREFSLERIGPLYLEAFESVGGESSRRWKS